MKTQSLLCGRDVQKFYKLLAKDKKITNEIFVVDRDIHVGSFVFINACTFCNKSKKIVIMHFHYGGNIQNCYFENIAMEISRGNFSQSHCCICLK